MQTPKEIFAIQREDLEANVVQLQIPEEVIKHLREDHLKPNGMEYQVPPVSDEELEAEEVLFCEPPKEVKFLLLASLLCVPVLHANIFYFFNPPINCPDSYSLFLYMFLSSSIPKEHFDFVDAFAIFMAPVVFMVCIDYTAKGLKASKLLHLFGFFELFCCCILYVFFYFDWHCYQVITNLRVARVLCKNNYITGPQIKCSYFGHHLSRLRDHKLSKSFHNKALPVEYFAVIYKNPQGNGGRATIHGDKGAHYFTVSNIDFLESILIQVLTKTTQNWPKKLFSPKNAMTEPTKSGYLFGILSGIVSAGYFIFFLFESDLQTAIVIAYIAFAFLVISLDLMWAQYEQKKAIFCESAFFIGDFLKRKNNRSYFL